MAFVELEDLPLGDRSIMPSVTEGVEVAGLMKDASPARADGFADGINCRVDFTLSSKLIAGLGTRLAELRVKACRSAPNLRACLSA